MRRTRDMRRPEGGRKTTLRRWNLGRGEYDYSKLGKRFYQNARVDVVASIPVTVHGKSVIGRANSDQRFARFQM